jgi:hypothetical protein
VTAGVHAIASRAPVDASSGASQRLPRGLNGVDAKARTMLRGDAYLREGGDSGKRRVRQSDLHRGRVWAESFDHGATFSFTPGSEVPSADA